MLDAILREGLLRLIYEAAGRELDAEAEARIWAKVEPHVGSVEPNGEPSSQTESCDQVLDEKD